MRVLLHTPLKSPDSPIPSGDREMARGLRRLLRRLGHTVRTRFSYEAGVDWIATALGQPTAAARAAE